MKLEDIKNGSLLSGIIPNEPIEIISNSWIGNQAKIIVYRISDGNILETTIYRDDESRINIEKHGHIWSFDADGQLLRIAIEAHRIKLAHYFDPYLAIHTSMVDPLPHQISAVYDTMLPKQPLRFLLADDPGAGKTIMAGLFAKELMARSDLDRCLIVAPGSLVEQWQDELGQKFGLEFDILTREMLEASRSGNPFNERNRLIARLDVLARNEDFQEKLAASNEWDLIICDEAHRMSASFFGNEAKYTKRYKLGQLLGQCSRHLLLMTATPHNGKEQDFQLFMALLDGDRFEGKFRDGVHSADTMDMMRRLTKEELLRFDGRPLFPERRAYTAKYELTDNEAALYTAVSDYVRTEMNRVKRFAENDGKKRNNVGFALQILQRRLASSPAAIYESLKRRRERLETQLSEARIAIRGQGVNFSNIITNQDLIKNIDEYAQDEIDDFEEEISSSATSAETVEQLIIEVQTLKSLEKLALNVLSSGQDAKWSQLNQILDNDLMVDSDGNRRKLIIFTEPKDTLFYLADKIRSRLGRPENVDVIHGGVTREERRKVVERFMQDKDCLVLVANDAAGEGVNLQRGHLMVNYDLPWNPNKIEQRFGRIHRIGQTEVCHLWNLVAIDTREGDVYGRLLEKLEVARKALGGRVYDVLGEVFEGTALKDLLVEAIQYGQQPEVKARLFEKVDGAIDHKNLIDLLERRSLTNDIMPTARVHEIRLEMEKAEAERLQPHHVQSFFIEAFKKLGGQIKERENGRWEITHVPISIRDRDRQIGVSTPVQKKYERICFDKKHINQQPVATFVYPGHPILDAVLSLVQEQHGHLMKQGAVLIDETDPGNEINAVFLLEHSIQDGRKINLDKPHIISKRLQFVAINKNGITTNAGIAPHLNLRPTTEDEFALVANYLNEEWLSKNLEMSIIEYATIELAQNHIAEVKSRRLPEIAKIEQEVQARLKKEINYWDNRAAELREDEQSGRKIKISWKNAQRRAENLADRLKIRMEQLNNEKLISAQPPRARGGMIVIPQGLLSSELNETKVNGSIGAFSQDAEARRKSELTAMEAVLKVERELGNEPKDVSAQKVGYDIASYDPNTQHFRFIEVKGRIAGADTVMLTRQEIITSLHEPEKYILAIVQIFEGSAQMPQYVKGALQENEPSFESTAIQFNLKRLIERAEVPS